jgi:TRAP-type C4-dicarboxylate transport system permease small subunit
VLEKTPSLIVAFLMILCVMYVLWLSINIHSIFMKYPSSAYELNVYHVYIVMQSGSIHPIPLT